MKKLIKFPANNFEGKKYQLRFFDILFSGISIIIFSPLFIVIALLIKLTSKGGVIFRQTRVGKNEKDFVLFKFRSMRTDANKEGLLTVGGRDSRITNFGYFLRKHKLDELPQLWNIFKGDMSIVGPRPEVRKYVNYYTESQKEILKIKPGLTDYASIEFKNESEMLSEVSNAEEYYIREILPRKIDLNKYFIDNYSLQEYFNVIFRTQLSLANFRKFLLRNKIAPKWGIFLIDLIVTIVAMRFSMFLVAGFAVSDAGIFYSLFITAVTCSLFFFILKPFDGIIQYSDINEALKIFGSVFFAFAALLFLNSFPFLTAGISYFNSSTLIVFFFVAFVLLFGYRLLVKVLFNLSIKEKAFTHVLLCGAGMNSSLFIKLIQQVINTQYKVIAFIDNDKRLIGKTIDDIRVYSHKKVSKVIKDNNVKLLFFVSAEMDSFIKAKIIDDCFNLNVKVKQIPALQHLIKGKDLANEWVNIKTEDILGRASNVLPNKQLNFLHNKKILITGAAGLIGSELARQLASVYPQSLILCDKFEEGLYNLGNELSEQYGLSNIIKVYLGDVKDEQAMSRMFSIYQPNIVFHAAAYKQVVLMERNPSEAICNNVEGTKIIADLSNVYEVERFLFVSTDSKDENTDILSALKRIEELYCTLLQDESEAEIHDNFVYHIHSAKSKTKFITARLSNIFDAGDAIISQLRKEIQDGGPITISHPDTLRYYVTMKEACSYLLEAVTTGDGRDIFSFDAGDPVRILDIANKLIKSYHLESDNSTQIVFKDLKSDNSLLNKIQATEEEVSLTHHKKLVKIKMVGYNFNWVISSIDHLLLLAKARRDEDVLKQIKRIIPKFIISNFESSDATNQEHYNKTFVKKVS